MKAIITDTYGGPEVMTSKDIEKPYPKHNEVLVKIHDTALNAADWHIMTGKPFLVKLMVGLFKPSIKILGADIAGEIVEVGKDVTGFAIGDLVFGDIARHGFGGLAEYVATNPEYLWKKPENCSFEEAAAIPLASITALQGLRDKGNIKKGQKVLVHGASGGVGTYAVQLAKFFGAEVTGVCSTQKIDLVKSLGADHVIDYKKENFADRGEKYDIIFAVNGNVSLKEYNKALNDNGRYVMAGGGNKQLFQVLLLGKWMSGSKGKTFTHIDASCNQEDLKFLKELVEKDSLKPIIDRKYPLNESKEAMQYLYEGHAKGKIIISVC